MMRRVAGLAAVMVMLCGAWAVAPEGSGLEGEAQVGYSVYLLTENELNAGLVVAVAGAATAYAGAEAGFKVGGLLGGIAGAAVGGLLGAL